MNEWVSEREKEWENSLCSCIWKSVDSCWKRRAKEKKKEPERTTFNRSKKQKKKKKNRSEIETKTTTTTTKYILFGSERVQVRARYATINTCATAIIIIINVSFMHLLLVWMIWMRSRSCAMIQTCMQNAASKHETNSS